MRQRRFYARSQYRVQGLIGWAVALLLLLMVAALLGRWQDHGRVLNLLGALVCLVSALSLLWIGWQFMQPQVLLVTERGGSLRRGWSTVRRWRWEEVERIDWLTPGAGRFAIPEPYLVLKGYAEERRDSQRYLVPLAPFSEIAYALVREQLLVHGWHAPGRPQRREDAS